MDEYIVSGGKKLKKGYTTGSCAAAAAKACVKMLFSNEKINSITIGTPAKIKIKMNVYGQKINKYSAECFVIKDAGDDPDVTNGIMVCCRAEKTKNKGIKVLGGKGIGTVTRKGLKVPPGNPAINPVPMKMIRESAREVLPEDKGVTVKISVPEGEEIAKKTFNPRLGIKGGISILGTTGIETPMSEDALKQSLELELSMLVSSGIDEVVYVFGNIGEKFAVDILKINAGIILKTSNYIGYMLDCALMHKIKKITITGHIGKLVKLAGGIFNTHSKTADSRMEILAAYSAAMGAKKGTVNKILESALTSEAVGIIKKDNIEGIFEKIIEKACERCMQRTFGKIEIECCMFDDNNNILAKSFS